MLSHSWHSSLQIRGYGTIVAATNGNSKTITD